MTVTLFEPRLAAPGGFFSFVFQSLRECRSASFGSDERPVPRMTHPRDHQSAWIDVDGRKILIDMSDHVFLIDLPALRGCSVYLKTNFHRETLKTVLAQTGEEALLDRIKPFFSFAGYLSRYLQPSLFRSVYHRLKGNTEDVCDVVGVYEHFRQQGEVSPYTEGGPEPDTNRVHYWARVHTKEALEAAGLTGTLRLTSRYQKQIEDGQLIFPNLSQPAYRRAILRAKFLVINTLPHALLPWKATEALALGRPFLVDVPPLTEIQEPYTLREGDHYLTLLPPAPFSSVPEGRVLYPFREQDFFEGALRVAECLRDAAQLRHMQEQVRRYRQNVLNGETLCRYIERCVEEAG